VVRKIILLIEDNPSDVAITKRALERAHIANNLVVAEDGQEALDYLSGVGSHALRKIRGDATIPIATATFANRWTSTDSRSRWSSFNVPPPNGNRGPRND
jgi:hypothetical protein